MTRPILLCTVGTSLIYPNLEGLKKSLETGQPPLKEPLRPLAEAYRAGDIDAIATALGTLPGTERTCGAEINSLASMVQHGYAEPKCGLYFFHSATDDGRRIAQILAAYYRRAGHGPVEAVEIAELQDQNPEQFRTLGIRNQVSEMARIIRHHGADRCAINATGGYKAQIAIAVLVGQALGVPVYYMHERFSEIVAFPMGEQLNQWLEQP